MWLLIPLMIISCLVHQRLRLCVSGNCLGAAGCCSYRHSSLFRSSAAMTVNDIQWCRRLCKAAYILVDNDGYGYRNSGQAIPEFEVRRALAHAMNVQLAVDNYYQELASVNYRTTQRLWAYPDNPENLFLMMKQRNLRHCSRSITNMMRKEHNVLS